MSKKTKPQQSYPTVTLSFETEAQARRFADAAMKLPSHRWARDIISVMEIYHHGDEETARRAGEGA